MKNDDAHKAREARPSPSRLLAAAALAAGSCATAPATTAQNEAVTPGATTLQALADRLVGPGRLPGVTVAVAWRDGRFAEAAAGVADVETGTPMTPGHRMFSGSVGKLFVATVVLLLDQDGRLRLDDRLAGTTPGRTSWFSRLPNATSVTLTHLLAHTSGIPEHVEQPGFWPAVRAAPDRQWTNDERVALVLDAGPLDAPGASFHYADTNFILLGAVVEGSTGESYDTTLARRVLAPCGLARTSPAVGREIAGLAVGYGERVPEWTGRMVTDGRYAFDPQVEGTGGGLVTTAGDLARFAVCLADGRLLPADALRRMTTPSGLPTGLPDDAGYGLGTIVWPTANDPSWGHSGFVPGYNAFVEYFPAQGLAIAIQTNTDAAAQRIGTTLHAVAAGLAQDLRGR